MEFSLMNKHFSAKTSDEPLAKPTRTLVKHTADVVVAFIALFGTSDNPVEFTRRWLKFFRLSENDARAFLRNGLLACFIHDWGKANTGFAGMLRDGVAQTVRHEVISALIITQPQVWRWLSTAEAIDLPLVLAAVVGHHLKAAQPEAFDDHRQFGATQRGSLDADFSLTWNHPKVCGQLKTMAKELAITDEMPTGVTIAWYIQKPKPNAASYRDERKRACKLIDRFHENIVDDPASHSARMLRAVRSALIAADSAGSALFRTHDESCSNDDVHDHIRNWIADAFDPATSLDEASIHEAIINPRLMESTPETQTFVWNEFQLACDDPGSVPARALLLAPCGSGKTLAAWRWVVARCRERPIARAIFLYPTRGTATEGFRDYVSHAGPDLAALVHGTSQLDLEHLQPDQDIEERIAESRLFALQQWPKRVFSATVDQFLAFLQHDYESTCLLPLMADSAVVLDEVHSYDRGMFTALVQFLEHFDIPVLAMTATMLERRKADLCPRLLREVNGLEFSADESRLRNIAEHPRYEISIVNGRDDAVREAESALQSGLRVLWVVNTVDRAQILAREFAAEPRAERLKTHDGAPILCYHSRFKLGDRRKRHDEIVKAFKRVEGPGRRAMLGVTTQVCELSLDLDCDVLITEYAPVSALIQRFGRCCRDQRAHEKGRERTGRVIVYEPESNLPYDKGEMKDVSAFLADVANHVVSQSGLEDRLADLDGAGFLAKPARFISDGPWAAAGQDHFRDAEDLTRQAILPIDAEEYERLSKSRTRWRAQEFIVPIRKDDRDDSNRPYWMPSWLSFADVRRHEYEPTLGYVPKSGGGFALA
jgi:CRISPR-associated endonuclease/helicase Cas3